MTIQTITCPNCGKSIPLSETLSHQLREKIEKELQKEYEREYEKKEQKLKEQLKLLEKEKSKIENARAEIEREVAKRLDTERQKMYEQVKKAVKRDTEFELKMLKDQLAEKDKKLKEAKAAELAYTKKMMKLKEKEDSIELEIARKIEKEREKMKQRMLDNLKEEFRLKMREKDKVIEDMRKTIDELQRKVDQGPIQLQGEVLEIALEDQLRSKFPDDQIVPVPPGIRGADIFQKVYNYRGQPSGTILWETKRTKRWSKNWITKFKQDQRVVKADVAILVTEVLPQDISTFGQIDGVWITTPAFALGLAEALRAGLIQVYMERKVFEGKGGKLEGLYRYLSGPDFRRRIEAIVEAFKSMKEELEQEKRAMTRMWCKREKQIEQLIINTAGMYGDLQGIIGSSMPKIKMLEMEG